MKRLIFSGLFIAFLTGAPVMAQGENEDDIEFCAYMGEMAGVMMEIREMGLSEAEAIDIADQTAIESITDNPVNADNSLMVRDMTRMIVNVVYDQPRLKGKDAIALQRDMIIKSVDDGCLKTFAE